MEIKVKKTHNIIYLSVDEIETTIFKSDQKEIEKLIYNLLNIVDDLAEMTDKPIIYFVGKGGFLNDNT